MAGRATPASPAGRRRDERYASAAHAPGGAPGRGYARHIPPNIMGPPILQVTVYFPETILFEASLSFLGLGIRAPMTSPGQMLGDARDYLINARRSAVIPGLAIFVTTLPKSIPGDWLRARLDPSLED